LLYIQINFFIQKFVLKLNLNNFSKTDFILLIMLLSFTSLKRIYFKYYYLKTNFIKCNFSNFDSLLDKLVKRGHFLNKSEKINKCPYFESCLLLNKNRKIIADNFNNIEFIKLMKKVNAIKCLDNVFYDEIFSLKSSFYKNRVQNKIIFDELKNVLIDLEYKKIIENHFKYMDIKISFILGLVCTLFKILANHKKYHRNKQIKSAHKKDKKFNDSCIICLENFVSADKKQLIKDNEIVFLECKHIFHERCIIKWLKDHDNCPICRFNLFFNKRITNL